MGYVACTFIVRIGDRLKPYVGAVEKLRLGETDVGLIPESQRKTLVSFRLDVLSTVGVNFFHPYSDSLTWQSAFHHAHRRRPNHVFQLRQSFQRFTVNNSDRMEALWRTKEIGAATFGSSLAWES